MTKRKRDREFFDAVPAPRPWGMIGLVLTAAVLAGWLFYAILLISPAGDAYDIGAIPDELTPLLPDNLVQ